MSTLHKFKAYFGMVPLEDYEDDYVDDRGVSGPSRSADERGQRRAPRSYADREYDRYTDERYDDEPAYAEPSYKAPYKPAYPVSRRDDYADERERGYDADDRYDAPRRPTRIDTAPSSRTRTMGGTAPTMRGATRGALAVDTEAERRMEELRMEERRLEPPAPRRSQIFEDGGPLSKITTLRPRTYAEAAIIGERFRDGTPVIMDLVEMSNSDARRLVDFAAGLAFALRGSFDKVATKVFLLSPADVDVSAEERRRIAENGFYNQK
ncbi:cell division protein SepF [Nocardia inohanensis]|uniref:cell division protein SepF n=1 Tax=Nocardia inohanensis TaxID=209246 RepID=UPI00082AA653|nr:cell division protein SepF [Nocardia inohanensis]